MTDAEWNVLDRKGMSVICLSLSRNVAFHTTKEKTTKGILQVLADMYEKPLAANKVHLMRQLFNLKMSESTVVVEHLNEFNLITLRGVRHILGLKRNLISGGQLDDEGYDLSFGSSSWKIIKGAMVVAEKRVSFSKAGRTLKEQKLELVYSDLWGLAPVTFLGGASYYMTFIDDSTRKVWVYFFKRKSDAFDAFRKWKALVENETGLKVKCLRSYNGGEYELDEFKEYCAVNDIRMEKTVRGTPQQNGIVERMNRTLNECARCMRLKFELPKTFWADAVNTAAFLTNRGPLVPLDNGIPEEAWSDKE
ncbi:hypothetical protein CRG98_042003, partial [Punica granatum]